MNPCTLGWYLPLLVKDAPGALQPSEAIGAGDDADGHDPRQLSKKSGADDAGWAELDSKFRRDLPDDVYMGRLAYRGLVMEACPRIRMLDGVEVTQKERAKSRELLESILHRRRKLRAGES